ncbi:hypothetical protein CEXT_794311 [Caerostris extrusa]|uniref:Secreted protein n=1 Tax=Caerostris extrusa TaxID=172846 RepID=A0AAV4Y3M9_CAEEX|nr:hypothetical protein CEXT_794311 [Caerostris extrusa]
MAEGAALSLVLHLLIIAREASSNQIACVLFRCELGVKEEVKTPYISSLGKGLIQGWTEGETQHTDPIHHRHHSRHGRRCSLSDFLNPPLPCLQCCEPRIISMYISAAGTLDMLDTFWDVT